jgi:hypothetical protein
MIPAHLSHNFPPLGHPRLDALALLNYIRYLSEPRGPGTSVGYLRPDAYEHEMSRIHGTAIAAIRMLGSEPGPDGSC